MLHAVPILGIRLAVPEDQDGPVFIRGEDFSRRIVHDFHPLPRPRWPQVTAEFRARRRADEVLSEGHANNITHLSGLSNRLSSDRRWVTDGLGADISR